MALARGHDARRGDASRAARLRRWIVAIGVTAIVANAASSGYDAWRSWRQEISDTSRELENAAQVLAEQLQGSFQTVDVLLRDTVEWYERDGGGAAPGRIDDNLAGRAAGLPQVRTLAITDAVGLQRYRSRPIASAVNDVSDRSYFTAHRDHERIGLFVSEPIVTKLEQSTALALSRRLVDASGHFTGVVVAIVELNDYQRLYRAINLGTRSAIVLLHANGTLVVRQPPAPEQVGKRFPALIELADREADHMARLTSPIDGAPRFVAASRVRNFPLVIAVGRDEAVALKSWRGEAGRVVSRTLVLTLLGGLAIAALVRQLRRAELGELALRESEQRYALAMEGANEGHWDWNLEGGKSFLSQTMKILHGRAADASVDGRDEWLAQVDIHPDDGPRMESAVREHLDGRSERYEVEYRVRHADGEWHWLLERGRCVRDETGTPCRFTGSAADVTARKRTEVEKESLEARLQRAQKLEAMGTLAGGIAHDFNNILGAILGYGEMAQKSAAEGSTLRRYLDNVMHAGSRGKALVDRILSFSRSGLGERRLVNVQAVVEETLDLLAATLPPLVRLEKRLDAGPAAILGDATQLHQVAMNLFTNAAQAMSKGGLLEVTLDRLDVHAPRALLHGELRPASYVRLAVRDTGEGIARDVVDRVFDPFFTTKVVGEGTGLGLSLVHGIVADLGGGIDVVSAPGGTTFTVWLPVAADSPGREPELARALPLGGGEAVMVVDDEAALVELAEEVLAALGYEPAGFHSGTSALQAFRGDPGRFDLVLTDETMPDMTGTALARELSRLRPDLPIVLMSGYADAGVAAEARAAGVRQVLRKPLVARDIAECLAQELASAQVSHRGTGGA